MVVVLAWMFAATLSAALEAGRFDIGFYAGHLCGLLAAGLVLRSSGRLTEKLQSLENEVSTFVAGVHARAWRVCTVGVFLAVSVPAVAWIQESAVLLMVGVALVAVVGVAFWWMWRRESSRA